MPVGSVGSPHRAHGSFVRGTFTRRTKAGGRTARPPAAVSSVIHSTSLSRVPLINRSRLERFYLPLPLLRDAGGDDILRPQLLEVEVRGQGGGRVAGPHGAQQQPVAVERQQVLVALPPAREPQHLARL